MGFRHYMIPSVLNNFPRFDKLPEKLIYKRQINSAMKPPQEEFVIFSPKTKGVSGIMVCHKSNLKLRTDYNGSSLAIDYLSVFDRKKGFGRSLINFAKNYSRQIGCNGHIFLMADGSFTPNSVPHVFYRKCGFTTLDNKFDKRIDKCIKEHKPANWKFFHNELMFYPTPQKRKLNIFKKITDKIIRILH